MRKKLLVFQLVVLVFILTACGFSDAPVISLNGSEIVYVEYDSIYREEGAVYTDNWDDPGEAIIGGDTVDSSVLGTYIVTYNITDSNDNEAVEIRRTVIVQDTTNPVLVLHGEETVYLEYQELYEEQEALFTDNYDESKDVIIAGDTVDINKLGSYEVTYNAVDSSGNIASEITRTVVVRDTTIPTISLIGEEIIFVEYEGLYTELGALFSDNYDENSEILITGDKVDSSELGTYVVRYNTSDSNENEAVEITRTVIVQDTTEPFITLIGDEVLYIEYEDIYEEYGAVFFDNYDTSGEVIINGDTVDSSLLDSYTITYNAIDSNMNEAFEVSRTVIVQDTTSPVLVLNGEETIYIEYQDQYEEQGAIFTDNYDESGEVVITGDTVNNSVLGSYTVTYNAVDSNGNIASEITRTVIVQDTISPVITLSGEDAIYLEYEEEYIELGAVFSDNYDVEGSVLIAGDIVNSSERGIYYITYNAVDSNGNIASEVTRTVVVGDIQSPTIENLPESYTIDRGDDVDLIEVLNISVTDNVDGNLLDNLVLDYQDTSYLQPGYYTVSFSVSDSSGNETIEFMELIVRSDSSNITVDLANLVVFIRFSDETSYTSPMSYSDLEGLFNNDTMSLQDYYLEVSRNDFNIYSYFPNNAITYYTDVHSRAYYEPYDSELNPIGYQDDDENYEREYLLLESAINYIEDNDLISPSVDLDKNNDGIIDNISFIVSNDVGEWGDLLWPHQFALWSSFDYYGDFYLDAPAINGDYAFEYTLQFIGETNLVSDYFSLGVLAHEMFHVIGAPDLYHYYIDDDISPVGGWDIMDWTKSHPNHMLLYMKEEYGGWDQDILKITETGTYSFNVSTSIESNGLYIDLGFSNEYLYIEYRDDVGKYESSLYDEGIIFYRVDQDFEGNSDGMYNDPGASEDEIYLFRSDTIFEATYLLEDKFVIEEDRSPYEGVMNSSTFTSIGKGTNIPFFFSDGTEIDISISLVSISGGLATITIDFN